MLDLLLGNVVLDTWQHNARWVEQGLKRSRHDAIASTNLDTLDVLIRLPRHLADLADAVRTAKSNFTFATRGIPSGTLHERARSETEYNVLLENVKTLSALLNNEIQLMIGFTTTRVSLPWDLDLQTQNISLLTDDGW